MSQQSTWLQRAVLAGTTNEEQQQGQGAPHWSLSAPVCRHCEHHNAVEYPIPADLCGHPDAKLKRNVVTGHPVRMKCEAARQELGLCGPAAMHFVARTADGELSQADAELALGCQAAVSFREPYGLTSSWARSCDSLSSLARSDSIADSSATACSGCARSPNSAPASAARVTVLLIGPQGCGKSTHAQAFAQALGCTHVIDNGSLNGLDVEYPASIDRVGALIIGPESAGACPEADLVIQARSKAGFDKAVSLLPAPASAPTPLT